MPTTQQPVEPGQRPRSYLKIALAAALWGTLGLFFRVLHDAYGLSSLSVAFFRAGIACVILFAALLLFRPAELRISRRSLPLFAAYGLLGIAAFYFLYVQAVVQTSVTTAVVLLYTAPAFVTLMAWYAWREPLSRRKLAALLVAFSGCAMVAQAYDPSQLRLNALGLILGLGAGFTYALYTIFTKSVLKQHSQSTALMYALLFGTLFLIPLQSPDGWGALTQSFLPWLLLLGLAIGPTLGSFSLYNAGLNVLPAGNASLVAMLEPVVASALAFLVLGEELAPIQILGGGMVIGGALWLASEKESAARA